MSFGGHFVNKSPALANNGAIRNKGKFQEKQTKKL